MLSAAAENRRRTRTLKPTPTAFLVETYLEIRDAQSGSIWVYEESNDVAGLQRGGVSDLSDDST